MIESHTSAGALHPTPIVAIHSAEPLGQEAAEHLSRLVDRQVFALSPAVAEDPGVFDRIVDSIEEFRQANIGRRVGFWGISGGGWLGLLYARKYPDGLSFLILESACGNFRRRLADPDCAMSVDGDSIVSPEPLTERMATTKAAMLAFDAFGWLEEVRVPVVVIAGEIDRICPSGQSERLANGLPRAEFVLIEKADHLPITTGAMAAKSALLEWLSRRT